MEAGNALSVKVRRGNGNTVLAALGKWVFFMVRSVLGVGFAPLQVQFLDSASPRVRVCVCVCVCAPLLLCVRVRALRQRRGEAECCPSHNARSQLRFSHTHDFSRDLQDHPRRTHPSDLTPKRYM